MYNLQILQTDIWGKKVRKKRKDEKHTCYLKIIKRQVWLSKEKEKTFTDLPKQKSNKVLNSWDRSNITKIIATWPRASLPRSHQTTRQDCFNREESFGIIFIYIRVVGIIFIYIYIYMCVCVCVCVCVCKKIVRCRSKEWKM